MKPFFVVCAVLLSACSAATGPAPEREFNLRQGSRTSLDGLTVQFEDVPSDSRCPTDVQCVHAGEAAVVLTLDDEVGEPARVTVLTTPGKNAAAYREYRLELLRLDPAPRAGGSPAETYTATLRVQRS